MIPETPKTNRQKVRDVENFLWKTVSIMLSLLLIYCIVGIAVLTAIDYDGEFDFIQDMRWPVHLYETL